MKITSSSSGSFACGTCGGGSWSSTSAACQKCGKTFSSGGSGCGCGGSGGGYIPSTCDATSKDCPSCTGGKQYRVGDCGKSTSTIESQYTKFP